MNIRIMSSPSPFGGMGHLPPEYRGTVLSEGRFCPELVGVEYMPEWVRASHTAAGGSGTYPVNGAVRVACDWECANMLLESEGDPEGWPNGCSWAEVTDLDPLEYADPVLED